MTENEFMLQDRISKIKSINELYDLENNAYISFSGGKDSTVLHYLIDEALPGNNIPRVFINTGIEYKAILEFVKSMVEKDNRLEILTVGKNITETLKTVGYPFKSKEHSLYLSVYQKSGNTKTVNHYLNRNDTFCCSQKLRYQFTKDFQIKVSNKCCFEFKKKPIADYEKKSGRTIALTGMMKAEGGIRNNITCIVNNKEGSIKKFHPLAVANSEFEKWYIESRKIELCELYYEPFNFQRTGCKGCPYSLDLQKQLDVMEVLLPAEKKQCEFIWKPIYEEYRRLGYRLRNEDYRQPGLF